MLTNIFKIILWSILLIVLQVLVFNHIHMFGYATPLTYVYVLSMFQKDTSRVLILLWGFAVGLLVDTFSNTPGVAAGSMTLAALAQPFLLSLFTKKDEDEDEEFDPTYATMGKMRYIAYIICLVLIQQICFFLLEFFSFFNWYDMLLSIACSSLLTIVILLAIESVRNPKKKEQQHG